MSSPTLFSREYYINNFLFNKDMKVDTLADKISLEKSPFIWNFRRIHAHVDSQGTIRVVPFSFFNEIQRYLSWKQDPNLVAVHSRLKELELKLQDPHSPESVRLKSEMSQAGEFSPISLRSNLEQLSACFEKTNAKSYLTLTMMKVVNFFRRLIQLEPLKYQALPSLNIDSFILSQPFLTPDLIIENHSSSDGLTTENFQRLKDGHLHQLNFAIEGKYCSIEYDQNKKAFTFSHFGSSEQKRLDILFKNKKNYFFYSSPIYLLEENAIGSSTDAHRLCYKIEYICYKFPGFLARFLPPIRESYFAKSGKLHLKEDCEYTGFASFSQELFSFKLERKTP